MDLGGKLKENTKRRQVEKKQEQTITAPIKCTATSKFLSFAPSRYSHPCGLLVGRVQLNELGMSQPCVFPGGSWAKVTIGQEFACEVVLAAKVGHVVSA